MVNYKLKNPSYFISASNGHDHYIVGQALQGTIGADTLVAYRLSLLDLRDKFHFGKAMADPNATFAPDTFSFHSEQFQTYATTPDLFSTMVTISTIENATFSLFSQPRGPNLYVAGTGSFIWGNDTEIWSSGMLCHREHYLSRRDNTCHSGEIDGLVRPTIWPKL